MLHRLTVPADREAVAVAFVLNLIRQVGLLPDFGRTADGTATRLALEEGDVVTFSPEQAALYTGDAVPGDAEVVDAEGLQLILALLRLSRTGEALPEVEARVASAAHRLLVAHVRYQTEGRIKSARAVLRAA
jgi:recombinational DNA repair protein (RecF pathway)